LPAVNYHLLSILEIMLGLMLNLRRALIFHGC
jgi:hypothetical protein